MFADLFDFYVSYMSVESIISEGYNEVGEEQKSYYLILFIIIAVLALSSIHFLPIVMILAICADKKETPATNMTTCMINIAIFVLGFVRNPPAQPATAFGFWMERN